MIDGTRKKRYIDVGGNVIMTKAPAFASAQQVRKMIRILRPFIEAERDGKWVVRVDGTGAVIVRRKFATFVARDYVYERALARAAIEHGLEPADADWWQRPIAQPPLRFVCVRREST